MRFAMTIAVFGAIMAWLLGGLGLWLLNEVGKL